MSNSSKPSLFDRPFPECFIIKDRVIKEKVFYCSACKVSLISEEDKADHYASESHKERCKQTGNEYFYCYVCTRRIWHKSIFQQHLLSKKHLKKVQEIKVKKA